MAQEYTTIPINSIGELVSYVMKHYTKPFNNSDIYQCSTELSLSGKELEKELMDTYKAWELNEHDEQFRRNLYDDLWMALKRVIKYNDGWEDWGYSMGIISNDSEQHFHYNLAKGNIVKTEHCIRYLMELWEGWSENSDDRAELNIDHLPKWELADRFYALNEHLQLFEKIIQLPISQNNKHKLIALTLGCSKDNAKKLLNGNYRPLRDMDAERKDDVKEYLLKLGIKDIE